MSTCGRTHHKMTSIFADHTIDRALQVLIYKVCNNPVGVSFKPAMTACITHTSRKKRLRMYSYSSSAIKHTTSSPGPNVAQQDKAYSYEVPTSSLVLWHARYSYFDGKLHCLCTVCDMRRHHSGGPVKTCPYSSKHPTCKTNPPNTSISITGRYEPPSLSHRLRIQPSQYKFHQLAFTGILLCLQHCRQRRRRYRPRFKAPGSCSRLGTL